MAGEVSGLDPPGDVALADVLLLAETRSDAELISAVRAGDTDAYGELFARHQPAAQRLAGAVAGRSEADDLVAEAFTKVLVVLQRGEGPDVAFRPYLLTAVRRLHVDRARATSRVRPTDDLTPHDPGQPFVDTAVAGFETSAAARALASLPERWQAVLWHTEVEGQKPAEIAPLLGMSANAVAALAYRAREGLRQAFVSMHIEDAGDEACATARANLGAYIRGGLSRRDAAAVAAHIEGCRECAAIYLELVEVNGELRMLLAPIVLGGAAVAYAGTSAGGGLFGVAGLAEFLKPVAGVAATTAAVAGLVVGIGVLGGDNDRPRAAPPAAQERAIKNVDADRPAKKQGLPGAKPTSDRPGPGQPSDGPSTGAPGPKPPATAHPTQSPTEGPDSQSPDPEPPSADTELAVTGSAKSGTGLEWDVRIRVGGLDGNEPATLRIVADNPTALLQLDPGCHLLSVTSATCSVQGTRVVQLLAVPPPGARTTLTLTVTPGPGLSDGSANDNTERITLAS